MSWLKFDNVFAVLFWGSLVFIIASDLSFPLPGWAFGLLLLLTWCAGWVMFGLFMEQTPKGRKREASLKADYNKVREANISYRGIAEDQKAALAKVRSDLANADENKDQARKERDEAQAEAAELRTRLDDIATAASYKEATPLFASGTVPTEAQLKEMSQTVSENRAALRESQRITPKLLDMVIDARPPEPLPDPASPASYKRPIGDPEPLLNEGEVAAAEMPSCPGCGENVDVTESSPDADEPYWCDYSHCWRSFTPEPKQ